MTKVMPGIVREQFDAIEPKVTSLLADADAKTRKQQRRFFLYLALLLAWFIGQPFADPVALHFVVQSLGMIFLALATGSLRVLGNCSDCIARLERVLNTQQELRDSYGVDLSANLGDPVENARQLGETKRIEALKEEVKGVQEQLVEISALLRMSEASAYLEMFAALRGKFESSQTPAKGGKGKKE